MESEIEIGKVLASLKVLTSQHHQFGAPPPSVWATNGNVLGMSIRTTLAIFPRQPAEGRQP